MRVARLYDMRKRRFILLALIAGHDATMLLIHICNIVFTAHCLAIHPWIDAMNAREK